MNLSCGIIGLPNVGKSTLFNALLKKQVADVANYPFCTIEPNVGVVEVPDERLPVLAKLVNTQKIVPAIVQFYDIAGLVKDAAKGAGLGNKFLSHIREVHAIVHVVRLFEDPNIIHVEDKVSPIDDVKTIQTELGLADLATLEKQPEPRMNATKEDLAVWAVVKKCKESLNAGNFELVKLHTQEEKELIRYLNLLSLKPVLYAVNVSEQQLNDRDATEKKIQEFTKALGGARALYLSAKLENEVLSLSASEQKEYLAQYKLTDTGLNRLVKEAYVLLDLISFLTGGEKEARAWTIKHGTLAPQAAAVIHTDFEKHFIKAEVIPFDQFVQAGGWVQARENGKVSIAGRDYVVKDGDVVDFKIGS